MQEVVVPALVGLTLRDAEDLAGQAGLVLASADPIAPLPPTGTVSAQQPLAGLQVPAGEEITVVVETDPGDGDDGGGSPVRPTPEPLEPSGQE
jgi:beta-lactam-binding protein with PASTA domain